MCFEPPIVKPPIAKLQGVSYMAICIRDWLDSWLSGNEAQAPEGVFLSAMSLLRSAINAAKDDISHPKHLEDWALFERIRKLPDGPQDASVADWATWLESWIASMEAAQNSKPRDTIVREDLASARAFFERLYKAGERERYDTIMRQAHRGFDDGFND